MWHIDIAVDTTCISNTHLLQRGLLDLSATLLIPSTVDIKCNLKVNHMASNYMCLTFHRKKQEIYT